MNINETFAEAADMAQNGFAYGYDHYQMFKAATNGDPMANQTIDQATQDAAIDAAGAEQSMPQEGGEDGTQPGTIGPAGMMVCPQCGTQMTPTLDLKCPACGFDVEEILSQAAGQTQPPAPGGGEVSAEQVTDTANQVKEAALHDPNFMQALINGYQQYVGQ